MSTVENSYDWKVTIIAQYTDSWKPEFDDFFKILTTQVTTPGLRITLFAFAVNKDPEKPGKAIVTNFTKEHPAGQSREPITCDLYDENTLKKFFTDEVVGVPSDHHALITWGHGAGLGYFTRKTGQDPFVQDQMFSQILEKVRGEHEDAVEIDHPADIIHQIATIKANLSITPTYPEPNEFFIKHRGDTFTIKDKKKLDAVLKVVSAQAMAQLLKMLDKPVDLFIANNCYCQMFETGFVLKDYVKIMVAAQTTYPITGFDYEDFFSAMQPPDSSDPESLAINVCQLFRKKYKDSAFINHMNQIDPEFDFFNVDPVSLSANTLSFYTDLNIIINEAGQWMLDYFGKDIPGRTFDSNAVLQDARDGCADMSSSLPGFIDLLHFVDCINFHLEPDIPDEIQGIQQQLKRVKKACNLFTLPPANTPTHIDLSQKTASPSFLSVFFPDHASTPQQKLIYNRFFAPNSTSLGAPLDTSAWQTLIRKFYLLNVGKGH